MIKPVQISKVNLKGFTVFEKNEIEFSQGLNVFIGKNGTGKTHLLKVLYAFLMSNTSVFVPEKISSIEHYNGVSARLIGAFRAASLADFVRKKKKKQEMDLSVTLSNKRRFAIEFVSNGDRGSIGVAGFTNDVIMPPCIYVPPQEMLSWYDGFIPAWENRENSFDETYYLLAKNLSNLPLKGENRFKPILDKMQEILGAKIIRDGGRFYLEYEWGRAEIHLVAEGLRKLASIIYLLANGSIKENSVIFWDEPEVHFNPKLIEVLVELLKGLTEAGIQVFLTTHDYLLSQRLSLIAEYDNPKFPVEFYCFSNEKGKGVTIDKGHTLADIEANPILDEFATYYDFEREKFNNTFKK